MSEVQKWINDRMSGHTVQLVGGIYDGAYFDVDERTWERGFLTTYEMADHAMTADYTDTNEDKPVASMGTRAVRYRIRKHEVMDNGCYRAVMIKGDEA